jgi:uncharacterized protein
LLACLIPLAFADDLPKPRGYVNDYANIIDPQRAQQIDAACASIRQSAGTQIAVVTVPSLNGSAIEDVAMKYLMDWGVGQKNKDNGVVILVARDERRVRIEVGYGMEGILPDGLAGEIIRYDMIPRFKQNDYGGGILAAVYKIGDIAGGKVVTYPQANRNKSNIGNLIYFVFILFFIIISMSGRGRGRGLGALWFLTGFGMGSSIGGGGFSSKGSGGFSGFGGFGGGMGGGGGASGGW